jgi:hypothetical protein
VRNEEGVGSIPPLSLSLSHFFSSYLLCFQSIVPCRRSYPCHLPTTNNTGSRVTSNEEPLTGQSGPVNLASKMAPKEKTTSKEKKKRLKKVRDIHTNRDVQPHRIQPENPFLERNLFLESLLTSKPHSKERSSSLNHPPPPCYQHRQETVQQNSCDLNTRKDSTLTRSHNHQPIVR